MNEMRLLTGTVRDLDEAQLRGGSRDTYESGKNNFVEFCQDMGHPTIEPHLLKWWVADRLSSVSAKTIQKQLSAIVSTARIGGAPLAFREVLSTEANRLQSALDAFKTKPDQAAGWSFSEVKTIADRLDWRDRFWSHQGITMLFLFVTAFRVSEATAVRLSDLSSWVEPSTGRRMLNIVIHESKNMPTGQSFVRSIPWEYLSIGDRILQHIHWHGMPSDSYLLRAPPSGNAPWECKPDGRYTQAGNCIKRLIGPTYRTHGARRGHVQLLSNQGASDRQIMDIINWRSPRTVRDYCSASAAQILLLYDGVVKTERTGTSSLPPGRASNTVAITSIPLAQEHRYSAHRQHIITPGARDFPSAGGLDSTTLSLPVDSAPIGRHSYSSQLLCARDAEAQPTPAAPPRSMGAQRPRSRQQVPPATCFIVSLAHRNPPFMGEPVYLVQGHSLSRHQGYHHSYALA